MKLRVVLLFLFSSFLAQGQSKEHWVDSVFNKLSIKDKVAQLIMIQADGSDSDQEELEENMLTYQPGFIGLKKGGPVVTQRLLNKLQSLSRIGVVIAAEEKAFDSIPTIPSLMQAAIADDSLVYQLARHKGKMMKAMGIHLYLGPQADLFSTVDYKKMLDSFGEDKENVARRSLAYVHAMSKERIASCPFQLTDVNAINDPDRFYPFKKLIDARVPALMASRLIYAGVTKTKGDTIFSENYVKDVLRQKGFEGLTLCDVDYFAKVAGKGMDDASQLALDVGFDVLYIPRQLKNVTTQLQKAVLKNKNFEKKVDDIIRRILAWKYDFGLSIRTVQNQLPLTDSIATKLFTNRLTKSALTVVRDTLKLIPIKRLGERNLFYISTQKDDDFGAMLSNYAHFERVEFLKISDTSKFSFLPRLRSNDLMVLSLFPSAEKWADKIAPFIESLEKRTQVVIVSFGNPRYLKSNNLFAALAAVYCDNSLTQKLAAQALFGGLDWSGVLPVSVSAELPAGTGLKVDSMARLSYDIPEAAQMDSKTLERIKDVVKEAINSRAFPGCQVGVARHGKIVYLQSFGYQTYKRKRPITNETIYDMASVTKISSTLQATMYMYDKGMIDLHKKASVYLDEMRNTNKGDCLLKDVLTHQAGMIPFIPWWERTMKDKTWDPKFYRTKPDEVYSTMISKDLYTFPALKDTVWRWTLNSNMLNKAPRATYEYRYSDMDFYTLEHVAQKLLNQPLNEFVQQKLYGPIGATSTGFLPLLRFEASRIAPTEDDVFFRKSVLQGTVHDPGAAMCGGVSGHAGLFSTANDMLKLGQLWLQRGTYGDLNFVSPITFNLFAVRPYQDSRRALGWDKPLTNQWTSLAALAASPETFGHTGFTGTCIWVDPTYDLVFVFLSNRVHPEAQNNKLMDMRIRQRIQEAVYESVFEFCRRGEKYSE